MRRGRRGLLLAAVAGVLLVLLPAAGSSTEPSATVDAVGTAAFSWSPEEVAVSTGDAITIRNATAVPHGVKWVGGPATPGCSGVPVSTGVPTSGTQWSGTCTFIQAGTYTFYCTVHGPSMGGTVTVATPGAPTVATGAASSIGQAAATLNGTVNPQGKATKYHFDYGPTTSYGQKTGEESAGEGSSDVPATIAIASLTPGTTYHYRLVAENAADTTEGVDRTFTTLTPPGAPSASTGLASALGETQATLNGTVNPNGQATKYRFEWGTSASYGQSTEELTVAGEDHSAHAESATATGLTAGTTYHFRVVAKNASGTVPGADQTFTTASPPAPETPTTPTTTTPPPAVTPPAVTSPPPAPIVTPAPGSPFVGGPSLRASQRGTSVKGSLSVSTAGAGGRLEVDVFARSAAIARAKASPVPVGRFVRGAVAAGRVSFAVKLNAKARRALKRHRVLALSVRITLTAKDGHAVSVTRAVVLR